MSQGVVLRSSQIPIVYNIICVELLAIRIALLLAIRVSMDEALRIMRAIILLS
jgi:hypothetical protein